MRLSEEGLQFEIMLNGKQLEQLSEFKYLNFMLND